MFPFIRDGEVLLVRPCPIVRRGDVVLCDAGEGRVLAHRVLRVCQANGRSMVLLQGDACAGPDGLLPMDNVIGCVTAVERGERRIRLDAGLYRWLGIFWIGLAPLRRRIYRVRAVLAHSGKWVKRLKWASGILSRM